MKSRCWLLILVAAMVWLPCTGSAFDETSAFQDDAEGILLRLTSSPPASGSTRSMGNEEYPLTVLSRDRGVEVRKMISAPAAWSNPYVNLTIEFDSDSSKIRLESYKLLGQLAQALGDESMAGKEIQIIGHCDSDGGDAYNLKLSLERAESVCAYLRSEKKIRTRLQPVGYGEGYPLFPNTSEAYKQKNRRVEIVVLN